MNKIFKVVWSKSKECYVVVSEIAKNNGGKKKVLASVFAGLAAAGVMGAVAPQVAQASVDTNNIINIYADGQTDQPISIGNRVNTGTRTIGIGNDVESRGEQTIAIGKNAKITTTTVSGGSTVKDSVAIGTNAKTDQSQNIVIGKDAEAMESGDRTANNGNNVVIGTSANVSVERQGGQKNIGAWNSVAIGNSSYGSSNAVAVGDNARADRYAGVAIGRNALATTTDGNGREYNTAVNYGSYNNPDNKHFRQISYSGNTRTLTEEQGGNNYTIANGTNQERNASAVSIGPDTKAYNFGVTLGNNSYSDQSSVSIGNYNEASGASAIAMGVNTRASGNFSQAYGRQASAVTQGSLAMGALARGGQNSDATAADKGGSVAMGTAAWATGSQSIAIGGIVGSADNLNSPTGPSTSFNSDGTVKYNATGVNTQATGTQSVAIGTATRVGANNSVALGRGATVVATNTTGTFQRTDGDGNLITLTMTTDDAPRLPDGTVDTSDPAYSANKVYNAGNNTAIGANAYIDSKVSDAVAIGNNAKANNGSYNSLALGSGANTSGYNSIAMGTTAQSSAYNSIAIGAGTLAVAQGAQALGDGANANALHSLALGSGAVADTQGSVAIGSQSTTEARTGSGESTAYHASNRREYQGQQKSAAGTDFNANLFHNDSVNASVYTDNSGVVSVGNDVSKRQIINVAGGTNDFDAVNVAQLKNVSVAVAGNTGDSNFLVHSATLKVEGAGRISTAAANDGNDSKITVSFDATDLVKAGDGVTVTPSTTTDGKTSFTVAAKNKLVDGTNTTVEGDGSTATPYKVNVAGDLAGITSVTGNTGSGKITFTTPTTANGNVGTTINGGNLSLGDGTTNNRIVNLAPGINGTDAVNVNQLNAVKASELHIAPTVSNRTGEHIGGEASGNTATGAAAQAYKYNTATKQVELTFNDGNGAAVAGTKAVIDLSNLPTGGTMDSFNVTSSADAANGGTHAGATSQEIKNGKSVDFQAGKNIVVTQTNDGNGNTVINTALSDDITVGKNGTNGVDGKIGVNGKDGSAVAINGKDGSIGLQGPAGANGLTIKGAKGQNGVDGTDGNNGTNGMTRIVYTDGNNKTHEVATMEDGLRFTGNNTGTENKHKLNTLVKVQGEGVTPAESATFTSAAGNINVVADGTDTLTVKLNKNVKGLDSVQTKEIKLVDPADNSETSIKKDGDRITYTTNNGGNTVTNKIANLADEKHIKAGTYNVDNNGTVTLKYQDGNNNDLTETAVITGIAKSDLSNITNDGVKKITGLGTIVKAGDNVTVTSTEDTTTGRTTYTVNAVTPAVYTDKQGNKVYQQPDGSWNTKQDGSGTPVAAGDVITSFENPNAPAGTKTTDGGMIVNNIGSAIKNAGNAGDSFLTKLDAANTATPNAAVNVSDLKSTSDALRSNELHIAPTVSNRTGENIGGEASGNTATGAATQAYKYNTATKQVELTFNDGNGAAVAGTKAVIDLSNLPTGGTMDSFNVTSSADTTNGGTHAGATSQEIKNGKSVDFQAGKNIVVTQTNDGNGNTVINTALSDDITVGKNGTNGVDGKIGVNGKDGSAVAINGKDGSIGLQGPAGANGLTIKGAKGQNGVDGTDGNNGTNGMTRIVYTDGNNKTHEVATMEDGLRFTGNNTGTENKHKLNTIVKVQGEGVTAAESATFTSAAGNINVVADGTDTLTVQLNKNVKGLDSVQTKEIKLIDPNGGNDMSITKDGDRIKYTTDGGTTNKTVATTDDIWTIQANGTDIPANNGKVNVKAGDNVVITPDATNGAMTISAVTPAVYTKADGTKVYKQPDGTWNTKQDGTGTPVAAGDIITSFETPAGNTTGGTMIINNAGSAIKDHATPGVTTPTFLDKLDAAAGDNNTKNAVVNVTDLKSTADALTDKGLRFDANSGGEQTNKLGSKVTVKGTGAKADTEYVTDNIKTIISQDTAGDTTINIGLAKDLTGVNSITNTAGGPTLTFGPTSLNVTGGNLNLGGNKITNLAPATNDDDAVNYKQLKDSRTVVTSTDGSVTVTPNTVGDKTTYDLHVTPTAGTTSTWTAKSSAQDTTAGSEVGKHAGDASQVIADGKSVDFQAGKNIVITQTNDGNGNTVINTALSDDITVGKDGVNGVDGKIGVNGKDGSAVVINGRDGSIGLNGTNGQNGISIKGDKGVDGVDGANGTNGITRIVYTDDNNNRREVATMDDGLRFTGNNTSTENKNKLNSLVTIKGEGTKEGTDATGAKEIQNPDGTKFESATGNIAVEADGNSTLTVKLNKNVKGLDSVQTKEIKLIDPNGGNDMSIKKDGDRITYTTDGGTTNKNIATTDDIWKIQANGTTVEPVNGLVNVKAGDNVSITSDAATGSMTINAVTPAVYTTKDGTKVYKIVDPTTGATTWNTNPNGGTATEVQPGDVITSFETPAGNTTGGTMIINNAGSAIKDHATPGVTTPTFLDKLDAAAGDNNTKNAVVNVTDLKSTADALTDKGLRFDANSGGEQTNKLGSKVTVKGTGAKADTEYVTDNIKTIISQTGDDTTINIGLAKDLTGVNSITNTAGGPTLTFGPTSLNVTGGNLNLGGNKITNLGPATTGTDAVNYDQLKNSRTVVTSTDGSVTVTPNTVGDKTTYDLHVTPTAGTTSTWTAKSSAQDTTAGSEVGKHSGDASQVIADGKSVDFQAGKNIVITQTNDGNGNTVINTALADNITAGKDGVNGVDGSIGATGKDGSSVVINGKDGSIGLTGPKGQDGKDGINGRNGANVSFTSAEGNQTLVNRDPNASADTDKAARIVYVPKDAAGNPIKDGNGNNIVREVATMDDGLKFTGNNTSTENKAPMNSLVTIKGEGTTEGTDAAGAKEIQNPDGTKFESATGNIAVEADGNSTLTVKLNKNVKGLDSVQTKEIKLVDPNGGNDASIKYDGDRITYNNGGNNKTISTLDDELHITPTDFTAANDGTVTMTYTDGNGNVVTGKQATIKGLAINNDILLGADGSTTTTTLKLNNAGGIRFNVLGDATGAAGANQYINTRANGSDINVDLTQAAKDKLNKTYTVTGGANVTVTPTVNGDNTDYKIDVTATGGAASTWNVKSSGNTTADSETAPKTINDTNTVEMVAGNNLTVKQTSDATGAKVEFALSDNIRAGKDGVNGVDGSIGATGKDGNSVVLNGKDGTIGINGKDGRPGVNGRDGANIDLTTAQGEQTLVNRDPNKAGDNDTAARIVYVPKDAAGNPIKDANGNNIVREVSTMDDGLRFTGNNTGTENKQKMNSLVKVQGEGVTAAESTTFTSASGNINVKADGTDTLEIQLNKNLKNITSIQNGGNSGKITFNDPTTTNGNGVTISGGNVSVDGNQIKNVKDGVDGTDAVNVNQMKANRTTVTSSDGSISVTDTNTDPNKGHAYDIKINNQRVVENAQTPVVYTDANGNKVYKMGDGTFNTKADGTGTTVQPGNVIASMNNGAGSTTNPMVLNNVGSAINNQGGTTYLDKLNNANAATPNAAVNVSDLKNTADQLKAEERHIAPGTYTVDNNGDVTMTYVDGNGNPVNGTAVISGVAKNDLSNITNDGKKVITGLGTIVKAGTNVTVNESTDPNNGQKTYTVNADLSGISAKSQGIEIGQSGTGKAVDNNAGNNTVTKGTQFSAGNNITVTRDAVAGNNNIDHNITYALNSDLKDITSITGGNNSGSINFQDKTANNGDGIKISGGNVNMGGNSITNLKPGTNKTDAATVGQMTQVTSNDQSVKIVESTNADGAKVYDLAVQGTGADPRIDQLSEEIGRVGAQGAALAALKPIQYDPLEPTQIMAGYGNYRGNSALALGVAHYKNESTMIHGGVSWAGGSSHMMANAGVTWKIGNRDSEEAVADRYRKGPISSAYTMQSEMAAMKAQNAGLKGEVADLKAENEQMKAQIAAMMAKLGL